MKNFKNQCLQSCVLLIFVPLVVAGWKLRRVIERFKSRKSKEKTDARVWNYCTISIVCNLEQLEHNPLDFLLP